MTGVSLDQSGLGSGHATLNTTSITTITTMAAACGSGLLAFFPAPMHQMYVQQPSKKVDIFLGVEGVYGPCSAPLFPQ
jgi:hypothetical protein